MPNNDKRFDELLDKTLADYSNAAPRVGIEERILARLDEQRTSASELGRTWLRWWPALGLATAAAIIASIFLTMPKQPPKQNIAKQVAPPAQSEIQRPLQKTQSSAVPAMKSSHKHIASHQQPNVHIAAPPATQMTVVKLPVFPAPAPLTDQERLLFAYLRKTDPQEIAANAKPDEEPLLNKQLNQVLPVQKNSDSNSNMK